MKQQIYCNSGDDTVLDTWESYDHVMIKMDNGETDDALAECVHGQFTPEDAYAFGQQLMTSAVKVWKQGRPDDARPNFEVTQ